MRLMAARLNFTPGCARAVIAERIRTGQMLLPWNWSHPSPTAMARPIETTAPLVPAQCALRTSPLDRAAGSFAQREQHAAGIEALYLLKSSREMQREAFDHADATIDAGGQRYLSRRVEQFAHIVFLSCAL